MKTIQAKIIFAFEPEFVLPTIGVFGNRTYFWGDRILEGKNILEEKIVELS